MVRGEGVVVVRGEGVVVVRGEGVVKGVGEKGRICDGVLLGLRVQYGCAVGR